jgi:hypothetical protein
VGRARVDWHRLGACQGAATTGAAGAADDDGDSDIVWRGTEIDRMRLGTTAAVAAIAAGSVAARARRQLLGYPAKLGRATHGGKERERYIKDIPGNREQSAQPTER